MKKEKVILKIEEKYDEVTLIAKAIVETASKYECMSTVTINGVTKNAKSIMGIMLLPITNNAEVEIECDGVDEDGALKGLVELLANGFRE